MKNDGPGLVSVAWMVAAVAVLAACAGTGCGRAAGPAAATAPPDRAAGGVLDVCADQLHELSGLLLLHYGMHGEMPAQLELVTDDPGLLECPVSGEAYVYAPEGAAMGETGVLVVYDSVPAHQGRRWGVTIQAGRPFEPMSARVIEVPEEMLAR
jgi:hypothetical protein